MLKVHPSPEQQYWVKKSVWKAEECWSGTGTMEIYDTDNDGFEFDFWPRHRTTEQWDTGGYYASKSNTYFQT